MKFIKFLGKVFAVSLTIFSAFAIVFVVYCRLTPAVTADDLMKDPVDDDDLYEFDDDELELELD